MFYSTVIFKQAGLSNEGAVYATIGMGTVNVIMTVVSVWLVGLPAKFQGMDSALLYRSSPGGSSEVRPSLAATHGHDRHVGVDDSARCGAVVDRTWPHLGQLWSDRLRAVVRHLFRHWTRLVTYDFNRECVNPIIYTRAARA